MYLFISKDIVDVYHLLPGDRVKVRLVGSFRLVSGVQKEEEDRTREERIESVLAVPKRRGRPRKRKIDGEL